MYKTRRGITQADRGLENLAKHVTREIRREAHRQSKGVDMTQKPLIVLHSEKGHPLPAMIEAALSQFGVTWNDEIDIDISVRTGHLVRTIQIDLPRKPKYRIRRCNGNRDAWMIARLREDGTEIESYGGWTTSYSIDSLLKGTPGNDHLVPKPGEGVELVV